MAEKVVAMDGWTARASVVLLSLGASVGCTAAPTEEVVPASAAVGETTDGFPSWGEQVILVWVNRARSDPAADLASCGSRCGERACYSPVGPMVWNHNLGRAARFHSANLADIGRGLSHDSLCTVVSDINTRYTPGPCAGGAACACVGGSASCSPTCTPWNARISMFGTSPSGENIAYGSSDPVSIFYLWLHEPDSSSACGFRLSNGHRYNILSAGNTRIGVGGSGTMWTQDFAGGGSPSNIVAGVHYPQTGSMLAFRANWFGGAAPSSAQVNVGGTCSAMTLERGSGTNGTYLANVSTGSGCVRYYFQFEGPGGTVTYPSTGSYGANCGGGLWSSERPPACGCTPSCGGRVCGDDGCGGSCGSCSGGRSCSASGTCICSGGLTDCGGSCVDTSTSTSHCGMCGRACGAGRTCAGGACVCTGGRTDCGGSCIDTTTDRLHCGACGRACSADRTCSASACICTGGLTDCSGSCVDTTGDRLHCGGCGRACSADRTCAAGACACAGGLTDCGGSCVDTSADTGHCGACGRPCAGGEVCSSGACLLSCAGGLTDCDGACVDTSSHRLHCGACGRACSADRTCAGGSCGCSGGLTDCGGACVDVSTDGDHCGACDRPCSADRTCAAGGCDCPGGLTDCGGDCVDISADAVHCGACDRACGAGETCADGACSGAPPSDAGPPADGGAPGRDGGSPDAGDRDGAAGGSVRRLDGATDFGCAAAGAPESGPTALLLLATLAFLSGRRRRRR